MLFSMYCLQILLLESHCQLVNATCPAGEDLFRHSLLHYPLFLEVEPSLEAVACFLNI